MSLNFEQGIKRILIIIMAVWVAIFLLLTISDISNYSPTPVFVDTIAHKYIPPPPDVKQIGVISNMDIVAVTRVPKLSDKIIGYISHNGLLLIMILFIPIIILWFIFYATKWIVAGFKNK